MTTKELESEMRRIMDLAKASLVKHGKLAPVVRYYKKGRTPVSHPMRLSTLEEKVLERKAIQAAIRIAKPDAIIIVSDVWVRVLEKHTPDDLAKINKEGISKAPDRTEAISVLGGSPEQELTLIQHYRREGGTIVFEEEMMMETAENECFGTAWAERDSNGKVHH